MRAARLSHERRTGPRIAVSSKPTAVELAFSLLVVVVVLVVAVVGVYVAWGT
jgi:uncharacterized protein (UPF0333 family)